MLYSISMDIVTVRIPATDFYSLFAEGSFLKMEKTETEYYIDFNADNVLIVFYHFPFHRRLYITCNPAKFNNKEIHVLEGVDNERSVLVQLQGRAFDRFKRSLDFIKKETDNTCFSLQNEFWFQMANLMRAGKNSTLNMKTVISRFVH